MNYKDFLVRYVTADKNDAGRMRRQLWAAKARLTNQASKNEGSVRKELNMVNNILKRTRVPRR